VTFAQIENINPPLTPIGAPEQTIGAFAPFHADGIRSAAILGKATANLMRESVSQINTMVTHIALHVLTTLPVVRCRLASRGASSRPREPG
jgi:hypothetical protein